MVSQAHFDKVLGCIARARVEGGRLLTGGHALDRPGWFIAPSVEWSIKDAWVDYANTLKSPSYAVANLNMGWTVNRRLTVFADVRNLFDEAYVSNFGAVTDARVASVSKAVFFPGDGRSAYVGVRMSY